MLVPHDDQDTLDFPTSCESYTRVIYYKDEHGKSTEELCHCVTDVVSQPDRWDSGRADAVPDHGCVRLRWSRRLDADPASASIAAMASRSE